MGYSAALLVSALLSYVSSLIVSCGGAAIAAPIAPYARSRAMARESCSRHGGFVEVFVDTPLEECEARDRKGLYKKARAVRARSQPCAPDAAKLQRVTHLLLLLSNRAALCCAQGLLPHFTGLDDPYERPASPEIRINSVETSVAQAVEQIVQHLEKEGYINTKQ